MGKNSETQKKSSKTKSSIKLSITNEENSNEAKISCGIKGDHNDLVTLLSVIIDKNEDFRNLMEAAVKNCMTRKLQYS